MDAMRRRIVMRLERFEFAGISVGVTGWVEK
jgi:hypothetical protein